MSVFSKLLLIGTFALSALYCQAENVSSSLSPANYSELHVSAANPELAKNWIEVIKQLSAGGDAFTAAFLKSRNDPKIFDEGQLKTLSEAAASIAKRVDTEDKDSVFSTRIVTYLERAAFADLQCNILETRIVPWSAKYVKAHLKAPGVAVELERIKSSYVPAAGSEFLKDRVRLYAAEILDNKDVQAR